MPIWKLEIEFEASPEVALQVAAHAEAELRQDLLEHGIQTPRVDTTIRGINVEAPVVPVPEIPPEATGGSVFPFHEGQTVVCESDWTADLTVGRSYEVLRVDTQGEMLQVLDDLNYKTFYPTDRFRSASA